MIRTTGKPEEAHPFTVSRVFARGEIKQFAAASVGGHDVLSQCDVKTRWDDGSLQHALISFTAATSADEALVVDFHNSESPCSLGNAEECAASALDGPGMLAFRDGKWGAAIETSVNGNQHSVSAREMLEGGSWRYWLRGPVVTQVIIEDQSPDLKFDWGYRDASVTVVTSISVARTGTSFDVADASLIDSGARLRVGTETIEVCSKRGNTLIVGHDGSCPSAQGRGVDGTAAMSLTAGAAVRIVNLPESIASASLRDRVVGYTPFNFRRGVAANAQTMSIYSTDLLAGIPVPFRIQIGSEELSVCKVAPGQPGLLSFGQSVESCPNIDGRGVNGTAAQAHRDNEPIFSSFWTPQWVPAPADQYKSLHPRFMATFYRDWPGVKLDYILENTWFERLQDQQYLLTLRSGPALEEVKFNEPVHHRAATRWRKTYWDGAEPQRANIDFNFDYLIHSRVVPNFDRSYNIPAQVIATDWNNAQASGLGKINGTGLIYPLMPSTGGRPDIGVLNAWDVRYLFTSDPRLWDIVLEHGHVSGHVPMHYRESNPSLYFDHDRSVAAFARPISSDARPAFVSNWLDFGTGRLNPAGIMSNYPARGAARRMDNWNVDIAHQPGMAFLPYLLTGDYYFLEEIQFWASRNLLETTNGVCDYCRHDDWAFMNEANTQTRGLAWALRSVGHAAFFSPDDSPEKRYFTEKLNNNIAVREGVLNITTGAFYDPDSNSRWTWGRKGVAKSIPNPLNLPHRNLGLPASPAPPAGGTSCYVEAMWQVNLNLVVWGHLEELGFRQITPLRTEVSKGLLHQILDEGFPKHLLAAYYLPTRRPAEQCTQSLPFETWNEVIGAVTEADSTAAMTRWNQGASDTEFAYPVIALAAASFLPGVDAGELSGLDAWTWFKANLPNQSAFHSNPKWALLPRLGGQSGEATLNRTKGGQQDRDGRPALVMKRSK